MLNDIAYFKINFSNSGGRPTHTSVNEIIVLKLSVFIIIALLTISKKNELNELLEIREA